MQNIIVPALDLTILRVDFLYGTTAYTLLFFLLVSFWLCFDYLQEGINIVVEKEKEEKKKRVSTTSRKKFMGKSSFPPGFRFHPTDVELIMYYLKRKILRKKLCVEAISEVKIYSFSPWDLPDKSCLKSKDREWFFFCPIERKYPNGARAKRATETGYWKTTGNDRNVLYNERIVGKVRTLVYYTGRAPKGTRTDWVMHEYRLEHSNIPTEAEIQNDAYVLCRLFEKSGPGPKNGAQYGAPFNEEEWSEDDEETPAADELASPSMIVPGPASSSFLSEPTSLLELSKAGPSVTVLPNEGDNDDIVSLLDMFTEVDTLLPTFNDNNEKDTHKNCEKKNKEGDDIFDGLGNLSEENGYKFSSIEDAFLELDDLNTPLDLHHHHKPINDESQLPPSTLPYNSYDVNFDHFYQSGGGNFSDSVQNLAGYNQSLDP